MNPILSIKASSALRILYTTLNKNQIDYVIIGGFATNLYGSSRELADIDVGVSSDSMILLKGVFASYVIEDYSDRYKDDLWDLPLIVLNIGDQIVDIFNKDDVRFFSKKMGKWETIDTDRRVRIIHDNMQLSVIQKEELIRYKTLLDREVDKMDTEFLKDGCPAPEIFIAIP